MRSSRSWHCAWRASPSAGMSWRVPGSKRASNSATSDAGDVDVALERALDVVLRERRAALAHVLRVGAQHRRLPPGQPGREHQRVEAVALVAPVPHRGDGVLEALAHVVGPGPVVAQPEVVDEGLPAQPLELVGALVDHLDAHRRQDREHLRQRERRADAEHLEPRLARRGGDVLVERQAQPVVAGDILQAAEVDGAGDGQVVLLVGLGERLGVRPGEAAALLLAVLVTHGVGEVVAPGAGRLGAPALEVGDVDLGHRLARRRDGPRSAAGPRRTRPRGRCTRCCRRAAVR